MKPKREWKTHIAEIASPIFSTFVTQTQLDLNFQVFRADNFLCAHFVDLLGFTVDEKAERGSSVGWDEGDGDE